MWFTSIIMLAVGALLFWVILRGYADSKTGVLFCALYFTCMGLGMLISTILDEETVFVFIFSIGLGGAFVLTSLFSMFKPFFCRKKTTGEYRGAVYTGRGLYMPNFSYCVDGKNYSRNSSNVYFQWSLNHRFHTGSIYPIWYSEKNPNIFTERRTVKFTYLWILLLGLVFCYLPFYLVYGL